LTGSIELCDCIVNETSDTDVDSTVVSGRVTRSSCDHIAIIEHKVKWPREPSTSETLIL